MNQEILNMHDEHSIELSLHIHTQVWDIITADEPCPSLFMAVPTIYSKLIEHYEKENLTKEEKEKIRFRCKQLR